MTGASSDRDEAPATIPEGTVVARYRVVRRLGAGAMGEVYEAVRVAGGGAVALKIVRPIVDASTEALRRFHREATLCAGLRHPNIVPVIDYGVADKRPFLVMPVLEGTDLDSLIGRHGALLPGSAVSIGIGAARGLLAAHDASIIHRDFKPANVFLDWGADGRVTPIVCDFGMAKALADGEDGGITATGAVLGTPLYMSPEQLLDSKRVDSRCDVWALGMTLYHALSGQAAFGDIKNYGELLLAMRDARVPPLQTLAPWIRPALARAVHAMLLPLDRRIPTIADAIDVLERAEPERAPLTTASLVAVPRETKALVATVALVPQSASELTGPGSIVPGPASATVKDQDPFLGRKLGGRYAIVARIGSGGMGAVYEAIDDTPARASEGEVAIKVMLVEAGKDEDAARRFLREAKAAARISSPHVARVLDTGVDDKTGAPYLVMDRLRGSDLAALLRKHGALEPEPAVGLFLHACDGLAAAHALGIVHRDVKPSNLFVHQHADGTLLLKICDFGIAKQLTLEGGPEVSAELTRTGGILGSPLYMSPEQAKSAKNVDPRSDVFSLALSLHEALSGIRPWGGRTSMGEIIVAVCTEDVPPLHTVAPWIDPRLAAVLARGLARDPALRWPTVADFGAALRPFALARPLRTEDLRAIHPDRRSSLPAVPASGESGRALAMTPPQAVTHQPISVSTSQSSKGAASIGIAVAGVLVIAGAGAFGVRSYLRTRATSTSPEPTNALATPPPSASLTSAPSPSSSSPSPSSSSSTLEPVNPPREVAGAASLDGGPVPVKPLAIMRRASGRPDAGQAAAAAASSTPAASGAATVGRGGTAADLPPEKK